VKSLRTVGTQSTSQSVRAWLDLCDDLIEDHDTINEALQEIDRVGLVVAGLDFGVEID
jgi:hypothetical protein